MSEHGFNGKERRAYVRLNRALKVLLWFSENNSENEPVKTYTAITKNISKGGLCIEVPEDQKELIEKLQISRETPGINLNAAILNENVEFSESPSWINCRLDYKSKSTTKYSGILIGLAFNKLPEEDRKQIHNYIADEFVKCYGKEDQSKAHVQTGSSLRDINRGDFHRPKYRKMAKGHSFLSFFRRKFDDPVKSQNSQTLSL